MSKEQRFMYCNSCRKEVLAQKSETQHIIHFILTIVFALLWLPIAFFYVIFWVFIALSNSSSSFKCTTCDSSNISTNLPQNP